MKKRNLALLVLAALLVGLLSGCDKEEIFYAPGYWQNDVFYSAFAEFRFTLPEGWEAASQESLDEMSAQADEMLDLQRGGTGQDPASVYHYELSAKDPETGNGILVLIQGYSGNANDYIDGLKTGAEAEGAAYSVGSTLTLELAGRLYLMVPLTMEEQEAPYQRQYLRKEGNYLINIMLFSAQAEDTSFDALTAALAAMENPD